MKWIRVVLSLLLVSGIFTGCQNIANSSNDKPVYNQSEDETNLNDSPSSLEVGVSGRTLTLCTPVSDSGMYTIGTIWPNSCSILYLDFKTHQQIYLCDSPNCLHNNENCTSFISLEHGNHEPVVVCFKDKILFVQYAAAGDTQGGIWIADGNGENRKRLFTTENGQSIGAGIYSDGGDRYLYFPLYEIEDADNLHEKKTLVQMDVATGEINRLFDYTDYGLYTTDRDCFVLYRDQDKGQEKTREYYYLYPGYTNAAFIQKSPFYEHDLTDIGSFVRSGHIYTYNFETNVFSDFDLASNETIQVDCTNFATQEDDIHRPDIRGPYGNYFAYITYFKTDSGYYESQYRYFNIQTGNWTEPIELYDSLGHQIVPQQVLGDEFCVITGYKSVPISRSEAGNVEDADIGLPQYALIDQQDFMNSIPNYQMINMDTLF